MTAGVSAATISTAGSLVPGDAVLVLFGATGDLASASSFPACSTWRSPA